MEPHDRCHWDEWLNKALQQYGEANPRPGIENRVLANVYAHRRAHMYRIWAWALGGVAVVVFSLLLLWHERPYPGEHHDEPAARVSQDSAMGHQAQVLPPIPQRPRTRVSKRLRPVITETRSNPKLERFPSPRPLSPQELAALRYAGRYPQEAVLVAKEQEKFDDEVRQAQQQVETSFSISNE